MPTIAEEDRWLKRLKGTEAERDAALEELSALLLRGLSRSLPHRYGCSLQPEDVVQEALMKILNSLGQFEGRSRFTTWAMTIATRVGISELRRKHCQNVSLDSFSDGGGLKIEIAVDEKASAAEELDRQTVLGQLQELIDTQLTDKQQLAIRALLEGLPVEEIASRTQSNRNAVYKLVHDARMKLREGFERAGIVADDIHAIFA